MTVTVPLRPPPNPSIIATGSDDGYAYAALIIPTWAGLLYVGRILPAYDPSVLRLNAVFVYIIYLIMAIGGVTVYTGLLLGAVKRTGVRLTSLHLQSLGLVIQSAGMVPLVIGTAAAGTAGLFIAMVCTVIVIAHAMRLRVIHRQLRLAPLKLSITGHLGGQPWMTT